MQKNLHRLQPLRKTVDGDLLRSDPLVCRDSDSSIIFGLQRVVRKAKHSKLHTCITLRSAIVMASSPNTSQVLVRPPIFGARSSSDAHTTMGKRRLLDNTSSRESDSSSLSMCQGIICSKMRKKHKTINRKQLPWFENLWHLLHPGDLSPSLQLNCLESTKRANNKTNKSIYQTRALPRLSFATAKLHVREEEEDRRACFRALLGLWQSHRA